MPPLRMGGPAAIPGGPSRRSDRWLGPPIPPRRGRPANFPPGGGPERRPGPCLSPLLPAAKGPAMITMDNVTKVYKGGTRALENINLDIQKGEFVFLVGPSGCGKTTLMRLLTKE